MHAVFIEYLDPASQHLPTLEAILDEVEKSKGDERHHYVSPVADRGSLLDARKGRAPIVTDQRAEHQEPQNRAQTGYSARYLRFLVLHWQDTDWEALRREWIRLGPGVLCDCKGRHTVGELPAHGRGAVYGPALPEADARLDVERAYAALPVQWRGRTEVQLYLVGATSEQLETMRRCLRCWQQYRARECEHSAFGQRHRARVAIETRMPAYARPRQQDSLPETGSPYRFMSCWLSGEPWVVEAAA